MTASSAALTSSSGASTAFPGVSAAPTGRLADLVDRQAGVVSRSQALAAGLTARDVDRHLARRRWSPLHPRVYLVRGHPYTDEARVRAAALWVGEGAVVVGAAAVWWHGLADHAPATVGVAVPRRCTGGRPDVLVRSRRLAPRDVVTVRGLVVPVRPLALLDAAVDAGSGGSALLRRALRCDVGLGELRAVARRSAGAATAARLLAALHPDAVPEGDPVARASGGCRVSFAARHPGGNGDRLGIATVSCEHRIDPRGRPGPFLCPGAR